MSVTQSECEWFLVVDDITRYITGYIDSREKLMSPSQKKAVERHRQRQLDKGIIRMELAIPKSDKELLRATALQLRAGGSSANQIRLALVAVLDGQELINFKTFLEMIPLEGVELERSKDTGRDIEF